MKLIPPFYLVDCSSLIMTSTVVHVVASVVISVLCVVVSCMPAYDQKTSFVAALHQIQRREVNDSTTQYSNKAVDNSTVSNGIFKHVTEFFEGKTDVIYRGLAVLGCISVIVVVYISFRYFRWEYLTLLTRYYFCCFSICYGLKDWHCMLAFTNVHIMCSVRGVVGRAAGYQSTRHTCISSQSTCHKWAQNKAISCRRDSAQLTQCSTPKW